MSFSKIAIKTLVLILSIFVMSLGAALKSNAWVGMPLLDISAEEISKIDEIVIYNHYLKRREAFLNIRAFANRGESPLNIWRSLEGKEVSIIARYTEEGKIIYIETPYEIVSFHFPEGKIIFYVHKPNIVFLNNTEKYLLQSSTIKIAQNRYGFSEEGIVTVFWALFVKMLDGTYVFNKTVKHTEFLKSERLENSTTVSFTNEGSNLHVSLPWRRIRLEEKDGRKILTVYRR